jgi:hypothetical protein
MSTLKSLALGVAAAALIAGAGIASAQTAPPSGGPAAGAPAPDRARARGDRFIQFLDTDKDGKVTLKEIDEEIGRVFGAADLKNDGKLTPEEFQRRGQMFMQLRVMTLFDLLDANGDGVLTKQELEAPAARWFKRYDKNNDGFITADELPQGGPMGRPGMGPRPGMMGPPGGMMGPNR